VSDAEIIHTIFTEFPYALFGSVIAGILCAYLGVYVVSKRVVFVGATLTQVAVAGIAFAHLPYVHIEPVYGSIVFTVIVTLLFGWMLQSKSVPRDTILGASFVAAIALRILMIQKSAGAEASEIDAILKGDILFITADQFHLLLVAFLSIMTVHLLFRKAFLFVSFDAETATTQGFDSRWWEMLFYLTIGGAISIATRVVGDVFVLGFLVVPPAGAILTARKVKNIFLLSILYAILPPIIGLYLAFRLDMPAGPTTVATALLLLLGTWTLSRLKR
jgi:ABC-type Mn2+/Zn2+ transport system permease subunit